MCCHAQMMQCHVISWHAAYCALHKAYNVDHSFLKGGVWDWDILDLKVEGHF